MLNSRDVHRARTEFYEARRRAERERLTGKLTGKEINPLSFDQIREGLRLKTPLYQGIQQIDLNLIVGSVGRNGDFTRRFLPLEDSLEARWVTVRALAEGPGWPPVDLFKVGSVYFVRDGNHRVSVAREMEIGTIEAKVWAYPEDVGLHPEDSLDQALIRYERAAFYKQSQLKEQFSDIDIWLTTPGRYGAMLAQIEALRKSLSALDERELSFAEAAAAWFELLYLPVSQIIEEMGLLDYFPDRTAADLFVWLSIHQEQLNERYGTGRNISELAIRLAEEYEDGMFNRMGRRLRRWMGQNALSPSERLDQELVEMADVARQRREQTQLETPSRQRSKKSMLVKNYSKTGKVCRVTFKLPAEANANTVHLVGEFNDWDEKANPMKKRKDGNFSLTISLPAGQAYRYRYLLDGERWENDWAADAYAPNRFGSEDSIVQV